MGHPARSDFSRALSAMVVGALVVATATLMLVTFQAARAGAQAGYGQLQSSIAAPDAVPALWRTVELHSHR